MEEEDGRGRRVCWKGELEEVSGRIEKLLK